MDEDAEDRGHLHGFGDAAAKPTRLQQIVIQREKDVAEAKAQRSLGELEALAKAFSEEFGGPQPFGDCLEAAKASPWSLALAAEFKRASPSKGDINADLNAAEQALQYTKFGASVLSVLTEPKWFKGTLQDLKEVRLATQRWAAGQGGRRPMCLRKDFLVDEYQVAEAAAHGADTALLMVSILPRSRLRALVGCCRAWGMEPLVEVVNSRELQVALDVGARVIGVNNRNLHTFELDKGRTAQIAQELRAGGVSFGPGHLTKVMALSGLATPEDIAECRAIGCSGVLIGEALMRAPDPGAAILDLMGRPAGGPAAGAPAPALPVAPGSVVVKVCGVTLPEDAQCAISAGASMIGLIFAKSKRQVSVDQAKAVADAVRKFGERTGAVEASPRASDPADLPGFAQRCVALRGACKRTPLVVGVFVDQPLDEVVEKISGGGCDVVQLHGKEDLEFIAALRERLPGAWVVKVVHLPPRGEADADGTAAEEELRSRLAAYAARCDALLLDTAVKGSLSGGTGAAFDWQVARRAQESWGIPVLVAGGLTDANVAELVSSLGPFGVDVASGVEDAPGRKNAAKTTGYVQNAKRARVGAAA